MGLGPAATFVAIRLAFWLGAAATVIWAPAPDRRLIGSAYGPASDFFFRTFAQWDARWFLQIAEHGDEEVPQAAAFFPVYPAAAHALAWLTGSTLVAGVLISLAAGAAAAWALAEIARPILGARGANDVVLVPIAFLGQAERRTRVRHHLGRRVVAESLPLERRFEASVETLAVAPVELCPGNALGRVLRVQVEGKPVDLGAEPALEPLGRALAEATEGSDVVRPDDDLVLGHQARLAVQRL